MTVLEATPRGLTASPPPIIWERLFWMALELRSGQWDADRHACSLPWPKDPEMPEGHACECGQRWVYQPARWEALYTVEDLRRQQEAGEFLRGLIPSFRRAPQTDSGDPAASVIVPIRP